MIKIIKKYNISQCNEMLWHSQKLQKCILCSFACLHKEAWRLLSTKYESLMTGHVNRFFPRSLCVFFIAAINSDGRPNLATKKKDDCARKSFLSSVVVCIFFIASMKSDGRTQPCNKKKTLSYINRWKCFLRDSRTCNAERKRVYSHSYGRSFSLAQDPSP